MKSAGGEKPQKAELSGQSELFKCLCAQWSVLKVDGGLLVREWVAENSSNSSVNQYVVPLAIRKKYFIICIAIGLEVIWCQAHFV